MSTIKISQLYPAGAELFQDEESFLYELTDEESGGLAGGDLLGKLTIATTQGDRIIAVETDYVGSATAFRVNTNSAILLSNQTFSLQTNIKTALFVP